MRRIIRHAREAQALDKKAIQHLSFGRLTEIYLTTKSKVLKKEISREAAKCGYSMKGFIVAKAIRELNA